MATHGLGITRACGLISISKPLYRYEPTRPSDEQLAGRLTELAGQKRRYGYRRLHVLLCRESCLINRKRTHRIYNAAGLMVRRLRCLNIVDDFTKKCLAIEVDTSLPGRCVVAVLERLAESRGLPRSVTVDNGLGFISKVLDEWAYRKQLQLRFIEPGKPQQNAYIESFNGKFRDECLNEH